MARDIGRPISRQALGRTAFLGSLYDATTDEFCERTIANDDIPAVAIRHLDENHGHSSYEFDTSVSKKLKKLNADLSLTISVLGGLVKSAGATSSYLYSRDKTSNMIEATFVHRAITRTESLNVSHKEFKSRVEPTSLRHKHATHVVTSIRWGADVFVHFEAKCTTAESKHTAKAGLKLELNKLLGKLISINPSNTITAAKDAVIPVASSATTTAAAPAGAQVESGSVGPSISFESTSTTNTFSYKITVFGDLIPTTCPKSIDELTAMLPGVAAGLQKTNGGKGRPLEYIMLPLSDLAEILGQDLTSDRMFRAMDENVTYEIQTITDEIDQLRTTAFTLNSAIQKAEEFFLEEELDKIAAHQRTIIRMERDFRSRLGKMLVRVRSGNAEPSEFDQLLVELESQLTAQKLLTKQLERGDINEKINFASELKSKDVLPVREPESLSLFQHRYPKHKLMVLYTSDELRLNSRSKWISVYFDFLRRNESESTSGNRVLFCYFDYDLNPSHQPQNKKLEIREYIDPHLSISTARGRPESLDHLDRTSGIHSLLRGVSMVDTTFITEWQKEAKARLDEMFAKSGNRHLLPYSPPLSSRNEVFDKLRRQQKNILLIGRSRIGKSSLKSLLADPTMPPDPSKINAQTEFPLFEQFSISGTEVILNFIDTPGLFQRTTTSASSPDNSIILQLIDSYMRSKVTQLHFICFCISMEAGINSDDVQIVQTLFKFFGPDVRKNACLIITHCESKDDQQRQKMFNEAQNNLDFKALISQLKQGVFFSGSIDQNDWNNASNDIYTQFETICEYRSKLIDLFSTMDSNPFELPGNNLARKIKGEIIFRPKANPI